TESDLGADDDDSEEVEAEISLSGVMKPSPRKSSVKAPPTRAPSSPSTISDVIELDEIDVVELVEEPEHTPPPPPLMRPPLPSQDPGESAAKTLARSRNS